MAAEVLGVVLRRIAIMLVRRLVLMVVTVRLDALMLVPGKT